MADKTRFLLTSLLDTVTVTASSTTTGLAVANVQNNLIRKVYRSTAKISEWVKFDAGDSIGINCFFIGNHNLTDAAVVRWQGHATDLWTSPTLNTTLNVSVDTLSDEIPRMMYFYVATQSYRWWRFKVQDSGNPDGYIQIGRIMAGMYTEPTINMSDGFERRMIDPSRGIITKGRQSYWTTRTPYWEYTYRVGLSAIAQQDQLSAIFNQVGLHTGFALALSPDSRPTRDSIYCQFANEPRFVQRVTDAADIEEVVFTEKN